jgi:hypothetical protein
MSIAAGQVISSGDLNETVGVGDLNFVAQRRAKDLLLDISTSGLVTTTALPARSRKFTPQDDMELRALRIYKSGGASSINLTVKLTCPDGEDYLLGKTVERTLATAGTGEEHATLDYSAVTGDRIFLVKGVQYQISIESDSATSTAVVQGMAYLRVRTRQRPAPSIISRRFRSGATLSPDDINAHQESLKRGLQGNIDSRYTTSFFILPFDATDLSLAVGARKIPIRAPVAYDIVGVEFYAASATVSATLSAPGLTGWSDVEAASSSAAEYTGASDSFVAHVAADTEVAFTVSGTGVLTSGYAVIHIRHDRHQGAPPTWSPLDLKSATTIGGSVSASAMLTSLTDFDAAVSADNTPAAAAQLRIWVDRRHIYSATAHQYRRIPASDVGLRLEAIDLFLLGANASHSAIYEFTTHAGATLVADYTLEGEGTLNQRRPTASAITRNAASPTVTTNDLRSRFHSIINTPTLFGAVYYWT